MTTTELDRNRTALEARQADLSGCIRNRDGIVIEKSPDALDEVQLAGEKELAIRGLDRESNMLRLIVRALARISAGPYGVCLHCEEEIAVKRIHALPWAAFCISCQEKVDRQEINVENDDRFLFRAA
jgi:DnaK suppressor protein